MNTVYFISSRTCSSDENKYKDYLLFSKNMSEHGAISLDNTNYWNQINYYISNNPINEKTVPDIGIRRFLIRCQANNVEEIDLNNIKEKLKEARIISSTTTKEFKKVYNLVTSNTINSQEWLLLAVQEICTSDDLKDVELVRPKWCDLLIQYILTKVENNKDVNNIHIFLHDKDIAGYDGLTQQLIDGVQICKEKGLISTETETAIRGKNLTIAFFKHTNTSCLMDVIGHNENNINDRIKELQKGFENAIQIMQGVNELKQLANKRKREIEKM